MLESNRTVIVLIDVQGRLSDAVADRADLFPNLEKLLRGAQELGVPVLVTEQLPEKLGATRPELAALAGKIPPIPKAAFSCAGEPAFLQALTATGRRQTLLCGIETHVCVYQTARDLAGLGYHVEVVADAVSSRTARNRELALQRLRDEGIRMTSVEMCLMEMLGGARNDRFRSLLSVIK